MKCKFCANYVEDDQPYCSRCGSRLITEPQAEANKRSIDTDATIIETKDPADWTFMDKVSRIYFGGLRVTNAFFIKQTKNLLHKKNLLTNNQNLLYTHPILYSEEAAAEIRDQISALSEQIGTLSEQHEIQLMDLKAVYESQNFLEAKIKLKKLRKESRKTGLIQWIPPNSYLQRKTQQNLNLLKQFDHFGEQVTADIAPKDLIRSTYTLQNLLLQAQKESKKELLHPAILKELEQVKNTYLALATEQKVEIPAPNFGKTFAYWFPNKINAISLTIENIKFRRLLQQGENWTNLPKAWEILEQAKKIMEEQMLVIYRDNKKLYTKISEETKHLIEDLTQETEQTKKETLYLTTNFDFVLAKDQIELYLEKLRTHQMIELISIMEKHLHSSNANAEMYASFPYWHILCIGITLLFGPMPRANYSPVEDFLFSDTLSLVDNVFVNGH